MRKVICFGDSWAAGAELKSHEKPFVHWVADHFELPYQNLGQEGMSLGLILHTVVSEIKNIHANDLVIVIVPPDTRWYDENQAQGFYTVMNYQRDDYFKFLNNKSLEWFRYHHALFIYGMQKIFNDIGCRYIMAHNYGQIHELSRYQLSIDWHRFLSQSSLVDLLSPTESVWQSYPDDLPPHRRFDQDGPPDGIFIGPNFQGCRQHPNETGHKVIARLISEKFYHETN